MKKILSVMVDTMRVGQQVMVVGAPYGLAYSMSVGWIIARWPPNTIFPDMPLAEFLQTTATINTGNSGGPVFSMAGEVIGIVSQRRASWSPGRYSGGPFGASC